MSGILAAIRCQQAGIPFVGFEKNSGVGGTWFENKYPGARVDSTNLFYAYSFAQKLNWPLMWSPQPVLLEYFQDVAKSYGVEKHYKISTEVASCTWQPSSKTWLLTTHPTGHPEQSSTCEAHAVIISVGQLNRPSIPQISGMDKFNGPQFHTARWDRGVDFEGKEVIVVGTGATGTQVIPELAKVAKKVTVFQRTADWAFDNPLYHSEISEGSKYLYTHVPMYQNWSRFWQFWKVGDGFLPAVEVEKDYVDPTGRSCGALNKVVGDIMAQAFEQHLKGRPDLMEKVIPDYPVGTKRIVFEAGVWCNALLRDNVELHAGHSIKEITETGIVSVDKDGNTNLTKADAIGFHAAKFLMPIKFTGVGGKDLHESWSGDARAYVGIVYPDFPNLFMMYGPNTNIVVNGSIVYFSECEMNYIMDSLRLLLSPSSPHHLGAMNCKHDVFEKYQPMIDEGNARRAWGRAESKVNSWYKNEKGRVAQNWPGNCLDYWKITRRVNEEDFNWE